MKHTNQSSFQQYQSEQTGNAREIIQEIQELYKNLQNLETSQMCIEEKVQEIREAIAEKIRTIVYCMHTSFFNLYVEIPGSSLGDLEMKSIAQYQNFMERGATCMRTMFSRPLHQGFDPEAQELQKTRECTEKMIYQEMQKTYSAYLAERIKNKTAYLLIMDYILSGEESEKWTRAQETYNIYARKLEELQKKYFGEDL